MRYIVIRKYSFEFRYFIDDAALIAWIAADTATQADYEYKNRVEQVTTSVLRGDTRTAWAA